MNIDVISVVFCNLDINKYEKVGSRLPSSEQKRVVQYWKIHTNYTVKENTIGKYWRRNDKLHRGGDLPAIVWPNGDKFWWKNNKRHRDGDLPAVEYSNGTKYWYKNDKLHRDGDLPAVEYSNGTKEWWNYGKEYYLN